MPIITPSRPNYYTGGTLDRAGHLRQDDEWIARAIDDPASRFVIFQRGQALVSGSETAVRAAVTAKPAVEAPWVFLGLQDGTPMFAADLSHIEFPAQAVQAGDAAFRDLRSAGGLLNANDATLLATARAMLHWRGQSKFCSACGQPNTPIRAGYVMRCTGCGAEHFPRTDPAVIMLVTQGDQLLLGQSHNFPVERNLYSTLAGFVEPGESLEEAVRREVFEEVGVRVGAVHYHSSQPWPFPASVMLGFHGAALNQDIVLEAAEMRDARWFTPEQIIGHAALGFNLPQQHSIARRLIDDWLESVR